jgi:hypothetical protein
MGAPPLYRRHDPALLLPQITNRRADVELGIDVAEAGSVMDGSSRCPLRREGVVA